MMHLVVKGWYFVLMMMHFVVKMMTFAFKMLNAAGNNGMWRWILGRLLAARCPCLISAGRCTRSTCRWREKTHTIPATTRSLIDLSHRSLIDLS